MPKLSLIVPTQRLAIGRNTDKFNAMVAKHTTDYKVNYISGDIGFASKLNQGIREADGEYLIFLHDDCELTPGWADVLPEQVGAFCLGEMNDSFDTWGGFIDPPGYCLDPSLTPDYAYWLCIKRDIMDKIGFFDERFRYPWCQDVDMGITIKKAGFTIECLPGKIIHRNGDGSGTADERQKGYVNRKWDLKL